MEETLNFSQTQRIVFLIDLNPLFFTSQNPKPYVASLLSSAQTLLTFKSLSSSLFAFKFFFSSLSPLLSTSKLLSLLGKSSVSFSFDHPSDTLISLSETLISLSKLSDKLIFSSPKGTFTAESLRQVVYDYTWEAGIEDLLGTVKNSHVVRSNLIVLFSPVCRSVEFSVKFLDLEIDDELGIGADSFSEKFVEKFGPVSEVLSSRDIHCSWIHVNYQIENERVEKDQNFLGLEKGIGSLGWGFCSTDVISLGSAFVPFGLIYPNIGCSLVGFYRMNDSKKVRAELSLTILDVSKKPLECKCCDLELVGWNLLGRRQRHEDILSIWGSNISSLVSHEQEKPFLGNVGDQILKISVKDVWKNDGRVKLKDNFCDYVLLHGFSAEHGKEQKGNDSDFFADHILQMLKMKTNEFTPGKPIWQVFLTFLYRQNYSALVSVSNGDGISLMGILKPFTIHSALLCVLDSRFSSQNLKNDFDGFPSGLVEFITKKDGETPETVADLSQSLESKDDNMKKHKKSLKMLKDLSWSSFRKAAISNTEVDLEAVYISKERNSKKLRFLECWMKQAKKSRCSFRIEPNEPKSQPVTEELTQRVAMSEQEKEMTQRVVGSEQESEQPVSSSFSSGEPSLTGSSNMHGETIPVVCSETSEAFFSSISQKIQQGFESKEVDLGAFAERLVDSCIYWLHWKHEKDSISTPEVQSEDSCGGKVYDELLKLLVRDPKDLAVKYKSCEPPPDSCNNVCSSEYKVREYELQILFRMEILSSKVRVSIDETAKQKMVKHICTLLENIQYHLEGGFFGDVSLDKYVRQTIKNRYSHSLRDVVDRIYTRMDLLLFDSDGGVLDFVNNSEDGDGTQRNKLDDSEIGENGRRNASTSAGKSSQREENHIESPRGLKNKEHNHKLMEAQERREWARRRASFTTMIPDLQRVWAPKQVKGMRETLRKLPKRKEKRGERYDVVCETPLTEKKRSCIRKSSDNDNQTNYNNKSCGSVAKALFQDDDL